MGPASISLRTVAPQRLTRPITQSTSLMFRFSRRGPHREAILKLGESERGRVLPSLPRHAVEPLLAAYCEWCSCTCPEPFQDLATLVPDLDFQVGGRAVKRPLG